MNKQEERNDDKIVGNMRSRINKPLSITILTGTLNPDLKIFRLMLEAIRKQRYRGKVRHYILDGGTTNGGIALAKQYGCTVRVFGDDANEGIDRLSHCKDLLTEDIVLILESDNIISGTDFLTKIVEPFKDKDIFATYPMHNTYTKGMDILTRYTALMGSPDPTLFYLGKSDKVPVFQKNYDKGVILKEEKRYYKVKFTENTLPTVGDNGFAVRTNIFKSLIRRKEVLYHTDKYMLLVRKGYATYGVTKNAIIHTTKPGIWLQVKRRVEVKEHCTDEMRDIRMYHVYDPNSPKDHWRLFLFIIYSLTFIQPLALSIRGFINAPDIAWFLHPVMCFLMVIAYGWSEIKRIWKSIL